MRILLASSELFPYSKTGGLADMAGALAKYLAMKGHSVGVVTPLYRGIREKIPGLREKGVELTLPLGSQLVTGEVRTLQTPEGLVIYFIDQPDFFARPALYGEAGQDYPDNAERFIFFSKCIAQLAVDLEWKPQIVHVHDWQTGLVSLFLWHRKWQEGWVNPPRTCLTVHNLAYQGVFPAATYGLTNLPWHYFNPKGVEFYGQMSCLKAGIVYSDLLTTVSPSYAQEITTEALGCGLDGVLRERKDSLFGILNGVDYFEWRTDGNPFLKHAYGPGDLSGKRILKRELQAELGLREDAAIPLFGSVTRLVEQKGIDILIGALEEMLATNLQFVMLGAGEPRFELALTQLAARYPAKAAVKVGYDHALAHRIEAAADFFLMPSRFEPCGLNQMYSLRYGTIPIVRATGGLDDSVIAADEDPVRADGIKFAGYSGRALARAMRKALAMYGQPEVIEHFQLNAMEADFSWTRTADAYVKLFEGLLS